jgi:hypothetical protein
MASVGLAADLSKFLHPIDNLRETISQVDSSSSDLYGPLTLEAFVLRVRDRCQ